MVVGLLVSPHYVGLPGIVCHAVATEEGQSAMVLSVEVDSCPSLGRNISATFTVGS